MADNSIFGFRLFAPNQAQVVADRIGRALGEPDIDTGWTTMPMEWSCTQRDEFRTIWWDDLRLTFERGGYDGDETITAWNVGDPGAASLAPLGAARPPGNSWVTTTEGLGVGSNRHDVLTAADEYMMVSEADDRINVITGALVVGFVMVDDTVTGIGSGRNDCIDETGDL